MNEKILIIDDEPEILNTLETVLISEGFQVRKALKSKKAMIIFTSEPFDLVITDIRMPGMNGLEVIKRFKQLDQDIEIIVLSGFATIDNAIEALQDDGAFDFLRKPLEDIDVLFNTIRRALEKRRLRIENKKLIEELRGHRNHLEELVAQRTAELKKTNERLRLENNERKKAEEMLSWEASINAALVDLSKIIISSEFIEDISCMVLRKAKHLTHSEAGYVSYVDPKTGYFIYPTLPDDRWESCHVSNKNIIFREVKELCEWVLKYKTPLLTNSPDNDPRYKGIPKGHLIIRRFLSVPAIIGEQVVGQIAVANSNRDYHQKDVQLLEGIAGLYAIAIRRKISELEKEDLQAQLRQAQKMEAIGTLAGGIAHDFNNVIYAILGYADLALDNIPKNNAAYNDISQIITAGERASALVNQILTFSRQNKPDSKPLMLQPIIKEVLKLLERTSLKGIKIRRNIDMNCGYILADLNQIHQVIMNLCTNACHAMREQGGVLEVSLKETEVTSEFSAKYRDLTPGRYARLTVRDTGYGMDNSTIERIFDPFFTTKKPGEGTGMGLSIIHGIVKNLNGAITVQSNPGKGTQFDLFFLITS